MFGVPSQLIKFKGCLLYIILITFFFVWGYGFCPIWVLSESLIMHGTGSTWVICSDLSEVHNGRLIIELSFSTRNFVFYAWFCTYNWNSADVAIIIIIFSLWQGGQGIFHLSWHLTCRDGCTFCFQIVWWYATSCFQVVIDLRSLVFSYLKTLEKLFYPSHS